MWMWSHAAQRATCPAPDLIRGRRRAAALDRRHHLQLAEAQMAGLGATPSRPVGAEDIRDLEPSPRHAAAGSGGRQRTLAQMLQWAFDRPQCGAGDVAVVRSGIQLLVTQENLDHPDVHLLLQEVGRKAVPPW